MSGDLKFDSIDLKNLLCKLFPYRHHWFVYFAEKCQKMHPLPPARSDFRTKFILCSLDVMMAHRRDTNRITPSIFYSIAAIWCTIAKTEPKYFLSINTVKEKKKSNRNIWSVVSRKRSIYCWYVESHSFTHNQCDEMRVLNSRRNHWGTKES